MARIALTVGGVIAGIATGGILAGPVFWTSLTSMSSAAILGGSIGNAVGRAVDPGRLANGPRSYDLSVSNSANGISIPFGYGVYRVGSNIIWSPGMVEHRHDEDNCMAPDQTTYSYTASFAAAFGEGPARLKKVWGDTKVIYDRDYEAWEPAAWDPEIPYTVGMTVKYTAGGYTYWRAVMTSLNEPPGTSYWGHYAWDPWNWSPTPPKYTAPTWHPGSQTQDPDATIQATEGAANTPAFRGLAYAVWEDLPLADFGNRIPAIRAEIEFLLPNGSSITGVADMVSDLCLRAGLDASEIDVSELS